MSTTTIKFDSPFNINAQHELLINGTNWFYPKSYIIAQSFHTEINKNIIANLSLTEFKSDVEQMADAKKLDTKIDIEADFDNDNENDIFEDEEVIDDDKDDTDDEDENEDESYLPSDLKRPVRNPLKPTTAKYYSEIVKLRNMDTMRQSIDCMVQIICEYAGQNYEFKEQLINTENKYIFYINDTNNPSENKFCLNTKLFSFYKKKLLEVNNNKARNELLFDLENNVGNWYGIALMQARKLIRDKYIIEQKNIQLYRNVFLFDLFLQNHTDNSYINLKQQLINVHKQMIENYIVYNEYYNQYNLFSYIIMNPSELSNYFFESHTIDNIKDMFNTLTYESVREKILKQVQEEQNIKYKSIYNDISNTYTQLIDEIINIITVNSLDEKLKSYKFENPEYKFLIDMLLYNDMSIDKFEEFCNFYYNYKLFNSNYRLDFNRINFEHKWGVCEYWLRKNIVKTDETIDENDEHDDYDKIIKQYSEKIKLFRNLSNYKSFIKNKKQILKSLNNNKEQVIEKINTIKKQYKNETNIDAKDSLKQQFNVLKNEITSIENSILEIHDQIEKISKYNVPKYTTNVLSYIEKFQKIIVETRVKQMQQSINQQMSDLQKEYLTYYDKITKMYSYFKNTTEFDLYISKLFDKIVILNKYNPNKRITSKIEKFNAHIETLNDMKNKFQEQQYKYISEQKPKVWKRGYVVINNSDTSNILSPLTMFEKTTISIPQINKKIFITNLRDAFDEFIFINEKRLVTKYDRSNNSINVNHVLSEDTMYNFILENTTKNNNVLFGLLLKMFDGYKYYMTSLMTNSSFRNALLKTGSSYIRYDIFDDINENAAGNFLMHLRDNELTQLNRLLEYKPKQTSIIPPNNIDEKYWKKYLTHYGKIEINRIAQIILLTDNWLISNDQFASYKSGYTEFVKRNVSFEKINFIRNVVFNKFAQINGTDMDTFIDLSYIADIFRNNTYTFDNIELKAIQKFIYSKIYNLNELIKLKNFDSLREFKDFLRNTSQSFLPFVEVNGFIDNTLNGCVQSVLHLIRISQKLNPNNTLTDEHINYAIDMLYMSDNVSAKKRLRKRIDKIDQNDPVDITLTIMSDFREYFEKSNKSSLIRFKVLIDQLSQDINNEEYQVLKLNIVSFANAYGNIQPEDLIVEDNSSTINSKKSLLAKIHKSLNIPIPTFNNYRIMMLETPNKPLVYTVKIVTENEPIIDDKGKEKYLKYPVLTLVTDTDQASQILNNLTKKETKRLKVVKKRKTKDDILKENKNKKEKQKTETRKIDVKKKQLKKTLLLE